MTDEKVEISKAEPDAAAPHVARPDDLGDWAVLGDHAQHPLSSDLNAATMLMPAPEFPAAYRTPAEILESIDAEAAGDKTLPPSDPNARTEILPPIDFLAPVKLETSNSDSADPAATMISPAATMIIPAAELPQPPPEPDITELYKQALAVRRAKLNQPVKEQPPTNIETPAVTIAPAETVVPMVAPPFNPSAAPPESTIIPAVQVPNFSFEPLATIIAVVQAPILPVEPPDTIIAPASPATDESPSQRKGILEEPPIIIEVPLTVAEIVGIVDATPPAPSPAVEIKTEPSLVAVMLAPPPDNPFGGFSDSSISEFSIPASARSLRAPLPSGANWRTVMNAIPAEQPKPVLQVTGLMKSFGKRQVVRGVDLEVGAGEIIGLLGRNGAGKTTTFRMIMGLLHPDGGKVTYENRDVTRLPMYQRANRGIGYLAQNPSIFQRLSVEENLSAVLELQEPSRKVRKARMEELIKSLGLEKVRKSQAAVLSGGERRRLEIARAMSLRPRIVLFDEPFAGIDPITVSEIQSILKDLKKQGVGVLITDHNVRETLTITDRTYIMDDGKIWIHGHPRDIVANEEARSRYLGHEFRLDF